MTDMDVKRAMAILNRASEHGMYDAERIPESDSDKIVAAEQQVQLAEQVEQVVHRAYPGVTDAAVIARSVPHWPAVCSILAEAKVLVGVTEPSQVDQAPTAPTAAAHDQMPEAQASPGDQTADREEPQAGQVWFDQAGGAWLVARYDGGQQAEVRSAVSGETTVVPAGFLKSRAPEEQERVVKMAFALPDTSVESDSTTSVASIGRDFSGDTGPGSDPVNAPLAKTADQVQMVDCGCAGKEVPETECASATGQSDLCEPKHPPKGGEQAKYDALVEEVEARYEPKGMPVPKDLAEPPSIDAESFADVDDATARILHGKYNALAARSKYLHDVEDAVARACELVRTHHLRRAMRPIRAELGKDATLAEVKARAEEDSLVVEWADFARHHADEAKAYKTFHDIYAQHVVVLSRDWSMREAQVR